MQIRVLTSLRFLQPIMEQWLHGRFNLVVRVLKSILPRSDILALLQISIGEGKVSIKMTTLGNT